MRNKKVDTPKVYNKSETVTIIYSKEGFISIDSVSIKGNKISETTIFAPVDNKNIHSISNEGIPKGKVLLNSTIEIDCNLYNV